MSEGRLGAFPALRFRLEADMPPTRKPAFEDLDLVLLALRLVSREETGMPESLRSYLDVVLQEAATLASYPDTLGPHSSPAAISLAVEIFGSEELRRGFDQANGPATITPELAERFLRRMDRSDVRPG